MGGGRFPIVRVAAAIVLTGALIWLVAAGPTGDAGVVAATFLVALLWAVVVGGGLLTPLFGNRVADQLLDARARPPLDDGGHRRPPAVGFDPSSRRREIVGYGLLLALLFFIPADQASASVSWRTILPVYLGVLVAVGLAVVSLVYLSGRVADGIGLGLHRGSRAAVTTGRYSPPPLLAARPRPGEAPPVVDALSTLSRGDLCTQLAQRLDSLLDEGAVRVGASGRVIEVSLDGERIELPLALERYRLEPPAEAARLAALQLLARFQQTVSAAMGSTWPEGNRRPSPGPTDLGPVTEFLDLAPPRPTATWSATALLLGWADELGPVVELEPLPLADLLAAGTPGADGSVRP